MSKGTPQMGLAERIEAVMRLDPAKGAIEFKERWFSWGELAQAMQRIESLLANGHCDEGAPVAVLARNCPAHVATLLHIVRTRRCAVMVNPFQAPEKVAADLSGLSVAAIVADGADMELPAVRRALADSHAVLIETGRHEALDIAGMECKSAVVGAARWQPLPGVAVRMLTSGTTGPPKRINLRYDNLERGQLDALFYESGGSLSEVRLRNAVAIAMTPLVHIGGLWGIVAAAISGRSIALLEKFSLSQWRRAVTAHRPKVVGVPPTVLRMIYDANVPKEELASLLAIRVGTAPLSLDLHEAFEQRYGIPILESYGATEFAGAVAGWTLALYKQHGQAKRGSAGRAQPGCELRVVDRTTFEILPPGILGLLEVKAPHQIGPDWIRTNDLALIDTDGFLFLRGRADDAIVRGGFKVLPSELVAALQAHPAVLDAGVVGLPDARLGAVPVAAVELKPGAKATEAELLAHLRSRLTPYQTPTRIRVVDALPRTPSMKVSQPELRELFTEQIASRSAGSAS